MTIRETIARLGGLYQKGLTSSEESDQFDLMIWREWPALVAQFEEMRKALERIYSLEVADYCWSIAHKALDDLDKEIE